MVSHGRMLQLYAVDGPGAVTLSRARSCQGAERTLVEGAFIEAAGSEGVQERMGRRSEYMAECPGCRSGHASDRTTKVSLMPYREQVEFCLLDLRMHKLVNSVQAVNQSIPRRHLPSYLLDPELAHPSTTATGQPASPSRTNSTARSVPDPVAGRRADVSFPIPSKHACLCGFQNGRCGA